MSVTIRCLNCSAAEEIHTCPTCNGSGTLHVAHSAAGNQRGIFCRRCERGGFYNCKKCGDPILGKEGYGKTDEEQNDVLLFWVLLIGFSLMILIVIVSKL